MTRPWDDPDSTPVEDVRWLIDRYHVGPPQARVDWTRPREVARLFSIPDHLLGIPTPWWRRCIQRVTRRV